MLTVGRFFYRLYTCTDSHLAKSVKYCKYNTFDFFLFLGVASIGVESFNIHIISINHSKLTITIVINTQHVNISDDERPLIAVNCSDTPPACLIALLDSILYLFFLEYTSYYIFKKTGNFTLTTEHKSYRRNLNTPLCTLFQPYYARTDGNHARMAVHSRSWPLT